MNDCCKAKAQGTNHNFVDEKNAKGIDADNTCLPSPTNQLYDVATAPNLT